jgi:hypothetical protein
LTKTIARLIPLLFFLAGAANAAPQAPTASSHRIPEYEATWVFASKYGAAIDRMAEYTERWQYGRRVPSGALLVGDYLRVERHLKLGAFYELSHGQRHDDDWFRSPAGLWAWRDPSRRPEHSLVLDATPRVELKFLPGHWVGSAKARFKRNFTADKNEVQLMPELAWFWMNGLNPRATVFFRNETDLALNFGKRRTWQRWWYAAALWHWNDDLSFGPNAALRDETWNTSSSFASNAGPTQGYSVLYRAWIAGFTVVARLR